MAELLTALTETEARLHIMAQVPGGPFRFVRKWQFVDATYADDLVKAAPSTVTNPSVDGQVHTGIYQVRREWGEPHAPDSDHDERVVEVFQELSVYPDDIYFYSRQTGLADDRTYLYHRQQNFIAAPVDSQGETYQADNTVNEDGTYNGRLVASLSEEANVGFRYKTSFFRQGTAWVYKNQRAKIEAPLLTTSGAYEVKQDINQDLTYDTLLMYSGSSGTGTAAFISQQATLADEHTTIYKDWATKIEAPADVQAVVYRADNNITEEGLYNAQLTRTVSTPATAAFTATDTYLATQATNTLRNQVAVSSAAAAAQGVLQTTANRINLDGTYDGEVQQVTSKESTHPFRSLRSVASTADTYAYQNMRAAFWDGVSASAGVLFRADAKLNADATYTGEVVKVTSSPTEADYDSLYSELLNDHTWIYRGHVGVVQGGNSATQAVVYDAANRLNEDGSYDSTFVRRTSSPYTAYDAWDTRGGTAWAYWARNQLTVRSDLSALFDTYGNNSKHVSLNQDMTYDVGVNHTPSVGGADVFVGAAADWTEPIYWHRNKPGSSSAELEVKQVTRHWYSRFYTGRGDAASFVSGGFSTTVQYWDRPNLWCGTYYVIDAIGSWTSV